MKQLALVLAALALPAAAHATVTYNLTLTSGNPLYSGTGAITLATAPGAGLSSYSAGQFSGLSFMIDGQTFTAPPGTVGAVQFLDGSFYNVTFTETIGTSPNRYALSVSGVYAFYYNDLQSGASGTITSSLAPPPVGTPEPATAAVLGTSLLALGLRARRSMQT